MKKLLGIKKEMTQVYNDKGEAIPVTLVDLDTLVIANKFEDKVVLGIGSTKKPSKSLIGVFKDLGYVPRKYIEVKIEDTKEIQCGEEVNFDKVFNGVKKVNVSALTKGKGFAGVIRRWNFAGGPKTHGQSDRHRSPGSIGAGTTPGRVLKGKKMGGRMGGRNVTVKNLEVVEVDVENKLLVLKGAIPGSKNSIITILL